MENYILFLLLIVQIGPLTVQRFKQICGMFFLVFKSPQIRFCFIEYSLETTLRVHRSISSEANTGPRVLGISINKESVKL